MRRDSFKTLRSYSVWGSFRSCENESERYCDWNSNGCWYGLFYSRIDPVTRERFGFQHTPSLIYVYIYFSCMGGLILTISPVLIFILLVEHKLVDPFQPHDSHFPYRQLACRQLYWHHQLWVYQWYKSIVHWYASFSYYLIFIRSFPVESRLYYLVW